MRNAVSIIVALAFAVTLVADVVWADVMILQHDKSGKASIEKLDTNIRKPEAGGDARGFTSDPKDPVNQFEPGELVVLDPPKNFSGVVAGMGYRIEEAVLLDGLGLTLYRVGIPKGMTVPAARRQLATRFPGATIDANHAFEAQARAKGETARAAMGWPPASATCGKGIRLGMIDSGVDTKHPALRNQRVSFRSFHRKGRKPGPRVHGTAIAAMLVGAPRFGGLLPGAKLMAASMFETKKDGGKVGSAVGLLKSLNWLAASRVHAINLSVAGTDNKTLRLAFDNARREGLVLIAAAGNWGSNAKPAYPAAYSHVVAVTAVNARKLIYSHANQGDYIDFAAPGVRIESAVPGGSKSFSGTSFATPYITAIVAAEIARGGSRETSALRGVLRKHSEDLGRSGKDNIFGYGFVNLRPRCE